VRVSGERGVLDLRLVGQESATGWWDAIDAVMSRGLRGPVLAPICDDPCSAW